jgi:hypothetical protein
MALGFASCGDGHLRGKVTPSEDGGSWLVVADGGGCGPTLVDGQEWGHGFGEPGPVAPGRHTASCGTELSFEIPEGVVSELDYWGP